MKKELLEGLSKEQIEKLKTCKDTAEMLSIAKEEGIELNDAQLKAVSGGACETNDACPRCHSTNVKHPLGVHSGPGSDDEFNRRFCNDCGYEWEC